MASRLDHVAMVSDEPLHVTCFGARQGSWLVLLGLLLVGQIALLSSCRSSARWHWFQNEKTPTGGMPTEVVEGISLIKKVSPSVGLVHKHRVLVPVTLRGTNTTTASTTFGKVSL